MALVRTTLSISRLVTVSAAAMMTAASVMVAGCDVFQSNDDESWPEWPTNLTDWLIVATPHEMEGLEHGQILPLPDIRLMFEIGEVPRYGKNVESYIRLYVRSEDTRGSSSIRFVASTVSDANNIFVKFVGLHRPEDMSTDIWDTT